MHRLVHPSRPKRLLHQRLPHHPQWHPPNPKQHRRSHSPGSKHRIRLRRIRPRFPNLIPSNLPTNNPTIPIRRRPLRRRLRIRRLLQQLPRRHRRLLLHLLLRRRNRQQRRTRSHLPRQIAQRRFHRWSPMRSFRTYKCNFFLIRSTWSGFASFLCATTMSRIHETGITRSEFGVC